MPVGHYRRERKYFVVNVCFACFVFVFRMSQLQPTVAGNAEVVMDIEIQSQQSQVRKLPKFWAHTGLCPPAPTNDAVVLNSFFGGTSMRLSMEMISALPNAGLKTVRIHWLLNLIRVV